MNEAYREAAAQLEKDIRYLAKAAGLKPGATMVLGCSTSEVAGGHIGKNSVPELGDALAETMIAVCGELGLHPVFQCCEHLNRALVMEQALLDRLNLTQVNVMPVPKAGGSTGAAAYQRFERTRPLMWAIRWWACMYARWRCPCAWRGATWARPMSRWRIRACPISAAAGRSIPTADASKDHNKTGGRTGIACPPPRFVYGMRRASRAIQAGCARRRGPSRRRAGG